MDQSRYSEHTNESHDKSNEVAEPPLHMAKGIYYAPSRERVRYDSSRRLFLVFFTVLALTSLAICLVGTYFLYDAVSDDGNALLVYHRVTEPSVLAGSAAEVYDAVAEAVVEVRVSGTVRTQSGTDKTVSGAGSGVVISGNDSTSYIITNHHVVDGFSAIKVRLSDGRTLDAALLGSDWVTDIAVLRVSVGNLKTACIGDSQSLIPGQDVVAIGNPLGTLGGSITDGIISGPIEREVSVGGISMTLIQSSAPVSPGNSGGGLFNMYGELVGIVNAKYASDNAEGISFAIPVKTAMSAAEQLVENRYVAGRADLGLTYTRTLATRMNGESYYQLHVRSNSRYDEALGENQILEGDRITHIDGAEITDMSDIRSALVSKKADGTDTVSVSVLRTLKAQNGFFTEVKSYTHTFTLTCIEYKGGEVLVSGGDIEFH